MFHRKSFVAVLLLTAGMVTAALFGALGIAGPVQAESDATDADAMLTVAHLAPFDASLAGTSVSVVVNGAPALTDFTYGEVATGISLPAGTYTVEIVPTATGTPVMTDTFALAADTDYTVAAIGDGTKQPLELQAFVDDNSPPPAGQARVRAAHLAPFDADISNTTVDLCTSVGGTPLVDDFQYKDDATLTLPAGTYSGVFIGAANPDCSAVALPIPTFIVADGDVGYLYAIGDGMNQPLSVLAQPKELIAAKVKIAHFAPFADTIEGTEVTIEANGGDLLTEFTYPQITDYVPLTPGTYDVEVFPTGGTSAAADPAITATLTVSPGVDYTVAAIGDGTKQPLELQAFVDDNSAPPSGQARVRAAHLAPFSSDLNLTTVDLCTSVGGTPLVDDFQYKEFATLTLPAGTYSGVFIGAANPDCSAVALPIPTFIVDDGDVGNLYAIGDGMNQPLSVAADPAELVAAKVKIAHFAPFANTIGGTEVTIEANGGELLTEFTYPEITDYLALAAGTYDVEVFPTGGPSVAADPAITATLTISPGVDYTVAAIGDGTKQPLELQAFVDDNSAPPAGLARLRAAHLAPFAADINNTTVDLCTSVGGTPLVDDFQYKIAATLELPAGEYSGVFIGVASPDCSSMLLPLPTFTVANGAVGYIYAIGDNDNQPLDVLALPEDLFSALIRLPIVQASPQ